MASPLTTSQLLARGVARLETCSESARLEAELLLAHALKIPRVRLKSHPEESRREAEAVHYLGLIERRAGGEPLAYITGRRDFWTLSLEVNAAVLVPRPETELLVERGLALCKTPAAAVLDLGTGSGAIALALASEQPGWSIAAVDASARALSVARRNAARLGLTRVSFLEGRWFEPVADRRFDLILSNPPYIAEGDPALPDLRFEPLSALAAAGDGMADLHTIIRGAPRHLQPGGWLALEHGSTQASAVVAELVARGFDSVRSHRDFGGHLRVTEGRIP